MNIAAGLRADAGPSVHGVFNIGSLMPNGPGARPVFGNWRFDFLIPRELSDQLAPYPNDFQLGSWHVLIQSFRATPASFHLLA